MYEMSEKMKELIHRKTGIYPGGLSDLVGDTPDIGINKGKPKFSTKIDKRKIGRGNPLLSKRRFRTIEYVDSRIEKL